jgi:hypothetical protein
MSVASLISVHRIQNGRSIILGWTFEHRQRDLFVLLTCVNFQPAIEILSLFYFDTVASAF